MRKTKKRRVITKMKRMMKMNDIRKKLTGAVIRGINEAFDIKDMGNDMPGCSPATK